MMRSLWRYLADDEEVLIESRRHASVLLPPLGLSGLVVAAAASLGLVATPDTSSDPVDLAAAALAAAALLRLLVVMLRWRRDAVVVTDRRILVASGVVMRRVASVSLEGVAGVVCSRSLLGRLLGYGDIVVESRRSDRPDLRLRRIPDPHAVYRAVAAGGTRNPQHARDSGDDADTGPLPRVVI